jgi:flagellar hook-associated protein 1 FlgK
MGMTSALNSALSGLRVSQAQMEVVSQNVANADSVGYTRRNTVTVQQTSGDRTSGATIASIDRQLDALLQRQLRTETSGSAYAGTRANYLTQLDQLFGTLGSETSLDGAFGRFTQSLQSLSTNPADYAARGIVLDEASQLAAQLNSLSSDIQRMREAAESAIGEGVRRANEALQRIENANTKLASLNTQTSTASLLDDRDRAIRDLAGIIDIRVNEQANNTVTIFTGSGIQLFAGEAATLTFDERSQLGPDRLFTTDAATRGVGTISVLTVTGVGVDITSSRMLRSGELAAYVELRDKTLVEAQSQLDELAAGLAASLSDRNPTTRRALNDGFDINLGTPGAPGTLALQPGNVINLDVTSGGVRRRYSFIAVDTLGMNPLPANSTADPGDIEVRMPITPGGIANIVASINGQLTADFGGGNFAVTNAGNVLSVQQLGAAVVNNASANVTNTAITGQGAELPLFVDAANGNRVYTGSFEVSPQKRGFAARIGVNALIAQDREKLVISDVTPGTGTQQGDGTRPRLFLDRLTNTARAISPDSGIGDRLQPFNDSVSRLARRIVEEQGGNAAAAQRLDEGQQIVLRNIEGRYSEVSGVKIDEELSELISIQNAYAANARIVSTVKELLDTLLRI